MNADEGFVHQASAVAVEGRALLIEGPPGSGKSSLALALIERGGGLIGDDAVRLTALGDRLIAAPPPNIAGLIELRGIGLVSLPPADPAPVALILELGGPPGDRLPDLPLASRTISGVAVPVLRLEPGQIAPAERALWALRLHGLEAVSTSLSPPSARQPRS
jgi:hypothetical protein